MILESKDVRERPLEPLQRPPLLPNLPKGSSDPNRLNKGDSHVSGLAGSVISRDLVQHNKFVRERGRARHHGRGLFSHSTDSFLILSKRAAVRCGLTQTVGSGLKAQVLRLAVRRLRRPLKTRVWRACVLVASGMPG